MNPLFTTPINSFADAEGFLFQLHQLGMAFHPEDNPHDVVNGPTGRPLFTHAEAEAVALRVSEVYQHMDDPCAYLLDLTYPATDESRAYGVTV